MEDLGLDAAAEDLLPHLPHPPGGLGEGEDEDEGEGEVEGRSE